MANAKCGVGEAGSRVRRDVGKVLSFRALFFFRDCHAHFSRKDLKDLPSNDFPVDSSQKPKLTTHSGILCVAQAPFPAKASARIPTLLHPNCVSTACKLKQS